MNPRAAGLLAAMNAERARAGLAPLRLAAALDAIAQTRATDMTEHHYFAHIEPDGRIVAHAVERGPHPRRRGRREPRARLR